jgi:hypothetical protein
LFALANQALLLLLTPRPPPSSHRPPITVGPITLGIPIPAISITCKSNFIIYYTSITASIDHKSIQEPAIHHKQHLIHHTAGHPINHRARRRSSSLTRDLPAASSCLSTCRRSRLPSRPDPCSAAHNADPKSTLPTASSPSLPRTHTHLSGSLSIPNLSISLWLLHLYTN